MSKVSSAKLLDAKPLQVQSKMTSMIGMVMEQFPGRPSEPAMLQVAEKNLQCALSVSL